MRFLKMLKGFFTEDNGNWSMMRLISFLSVIAALILAILTGIKMYNQQPIILHGANGIESSVIQPDISFIGAMTFFIMAILGLAFTGKVTQKMTEQKIEQKPEQHHD